MSEKQKIRLLDKDVYSKIAAGEVIEQPSSVIRELLDNSIDAGADRINIDIKDGGKTFLMLEDNGSGMSKQDLELSVKKHSTSKIQTPEDLFLVTSLGFRGEALYSIAAVSNLNIVSYDGDGGWELSTEGGNLNYIREAAGSKGTVIKVGKLFYNTPARREFLKSNIAENRAVKKNVLEKMLAFPDRAIRLNIDGENVLKSSSTDFLQRISDTYGSKLSEQLIEVSGEIQGITLRGFVSPVHLNTSTRKDQFFIINGRPISTPSLFHAAERAYDNMLERNRHPYIFLHIVIDPAMLNVNIHPAKREIRFRDEKVLYQLVYRSIKLALSQKGVFAKLTDEAGNFSSSSSPANYKPSAAADQHFVFKDDIQNYQTQNSESGTEESAFLFKDRLKGVFEGFTVKDYVFNNYWFLENGNKILLVDQHAAHERVLYEKYKTAFQENNIESQALLIPVQLDLSPSEIAILNENMDNIKEAGFTIDSFGPDSYMIQESPAYMKGNEEAALKDLLAEFSKGKTKVKSDFKEKMISTLACHSAVRQGDILVKAGIIDILNSLSELERPFSCPHGRPSIVEIGKSEVEKWFQRT